MGSQSSKAFFESLKAYSDEDSPSNHDLASVVSEHDASTIRRQWRKIILDGDNNGKRLFLELLKEDDIMVKFSFAIANHGDYEKTVKDARLTFHIRRVFAMVTYVVDVLAPTRELIEKLNWVGSLHKGHNVSQTQLLKFKKVLIKMMVEHFPHEAARTEVLWGHVMDFIIHHMTHYVEVVDPDPEVDHVNKIKKRAFAFEPNAY